MSYFAVSFLNSLDFCLKFLEPLIFLSLFNSFRSADEKSSLLFCFLIVSALMASSRSVPRRSKGAGAYLLALPTTGNISVSEFGFVSINVSVRSLAYWGWGISLLFWDPNRIASKPGLFGVVYPADELIFKIKSCSVLAPVDYLLSGH